MVIGLAISVLSAGFITARIGYFTLALLIGSCLVAISAGLITTFSPESSVAEWIVFQGLYGFGCGLIWQAPYLVVHTVIRKEQLPAALVFLAFTFSFGGILLLPIAQTVFTHSLAVRLAKIVPGLTASIIAGTGVVSLIDRTHGSQRVAVLHAYNQAIVNVFYLSVGLGYAAFLFALFIKVEPFNRGKVDKGPNEVNVPNAEDCHDTYLLDGVTRHSLFRLLTE